MVNGIHTAYTINSSVATCLKNKGRSFVGRYFRLRNLDGCQLTIPEAQIITRAGLYIVSIFEDGNPTSKTYFTYDRGYVDARGAFDLAANNFSQPSNTPVYFAVDFDAVASDKTAILDYFRGVQDGYNRYRMDQRQQGEPEYPYAIGVYGSYDVLGWCKEKSVARYFFQAYAQGWSGKRNSNDWPGYSLRQRSSNIPNVCGITVDDDESSGSAGGWKIPLPTFAEVAEASPPQV
ncbi:DUF1906 domain-containing protein [Vitiosangium sp. GDMCC 1.1324]|uniref:DUF1906 domain-containing protein n=1 Tax=Vitiosangium sp. (strain GDMCC 1.1324) TaxID=2138576 RepID=UPI000D3C0BFC|nr:DUF1906 domain-containing protein [Vitiosangium sp. GDMCC 1.1324]PTL82474.1 hypothetical protein DAT35_16810 [Vitiosangium sp. GDMCC 1.1324]